MMTYRNLLLYFALSLLVLLTACKKEEIKQYKAAKDSTPVAKHNDHDGHDHGHDHDHEGHDHDGHDHGKKAETPAASSVSQRLLGAIAIHADKTWFFKLVGPSEAVGKQLEKFNAFVDSLQFNEDLVKPVTWTLPEGWSLAEEASGSIRYATLRTGEGMPDLTIIPFPGAAGGIEDNINRWRGQLGLAPFADPAEYRSALKPKQLGGKQVIQVDMSGGGGAATTGSSNAPVAPFAQPPVGAPAARGQELAPVIEQTPADSPLVYEVPKGWKQHEPRGMRKADFSVGQDDNIAQTTFIPLQGTAGGTVSNVNRWRGQAGLESLGADELEKQATEIEVDGIKGQYFDIQAKDTRILAIIVMRGDVSWFIKMTGPPAVVEAEKANFETLVKSVKFKG